MRKTICLISAVALLFASCKREEGCIDPLAMNYNIEAEKDDGSCIFAYDIAQGVWNINPDCEEYTIPIVGTTIALNDQLPESVDVQGGGGNNLYIDINGSVVEGNIDSDGELTVPLQTIQIDMGFGPMGIDITGDGQIESEVSGNLNLTYSFEIEAIPGFPISESLDCSIVLSR